MKLQDLVTAIDKQRQHSNLSSAIRLFVLDFYRSRASDIEAEVNLHEMHPLPRHWVGVRDARRSPVGRRACVRLRRGGDAVPGVQPSDKDHPPRLPKGFQRDDKPGRRLMTQALILKRAPIGWNQGSFLRCELRHTLRRTKKRSSNAVECLSQDTK